MALSIANIALLTLYIWTAVTFVRAASCKSPSIRREWRTLSVQERAEWIEAVNVRFFPFHHIVPEIQPTVSVCRPNLTTPILLQRSQRT